ncbi:hypothetical protein NE865_02825 [Phthorimaea operculella]|nr:hypothetical protein NE865_02825 [Phthorimaea operculella]
MYKIFLLAALVAAVAAQQGHHDNHQYHAYSSQSIHRHDGHAHPVEYKDKHGHKIVDYYVSIDLYCKIWVTIGFMGYYSLHEPDGTVRIVHYQADHKNGFQAQVERKGKAAHIIPTHHH